MAVKDKKNQNFECLENETERLSFSAADKENGREVTSNKEISHTLKHEAETLVSVPWGDTTSAFTVPVLHGLPNEFAFVFPQEQVVWIGHVKFHFLARV